jgi:23S rRNA (uracil1939-C5)-methyltransferase
VPVGEVVAAPPALGYRNKIELSFGRDPDARSVLGYHRAGAPSELIDVEDCLIADGRLQPLLAASRAFFLRGPGSAEPMISDPREDVRLVLRASSTRDERLIAVRGLQGPFPSAAEFANAVLAGDDGVVGVVRLTTGRGRRGGARVETIAGRSWICEDILGTSFEVPAATFLQVHPAAAELLGRSVVERADGPRDVLELYGGIGSIGLALAREGANVTVVDADPAAVACGAAAAERHRLDTASFECADVLRFLTAQRRVKSPDLVVADPPRTGLGRGVAARLAALGAASIAMISCDPPTLARDLAELAARGYVAESITPFDLFPQTAHVETVTWLRRAS